MPRNVLDELIELLALEAIEENLFRGQSQDLGWGNVFGGQVLGQALSAAAQTVPEDRHVHSMHGYFLRVGDASKPIVYEVDRIRDGRSFTTRRVVAIQKGRPIFNLSASYQIEEPGFDHQIDAPASPEPEELLSEQALARLVIDSIPTKYRERAVADRPIETRPVKPSNPLSAEVLEPSRQLWIRAAKRIPDTPALHRYLLAYASDFNFLTTAMRPHGVSVFSPTMQVASLDHSMWFHRSFRMDEWLLFCIDSPSASGARGIVTGRFYDRQGRLVATAVQEGLMRQRDEPKVSQDGS